MICEMMICKDMDDAVERHDRNGDTGFYDSFENVREDHKRFYAKYPHFAKEWLYDAETNEVYHTSHFNGQRILNKHTLHSTISNGSVNFVMAQRNGDTISFHKLDASCDKTAKGMRTEWCGISHDNFLSGDL